MISMGDGILASLVGWVVGGGIWGGVFCYFPIIPMISMGDGLLALLVGLGAPTLTIPLKGRGFLDFGGV